MTVADYSMHAISYAAGSAPAQASAVAATGADAFSFKDLLDIVNPLQHLPVVSTLYRALSGDTIKVGPKIAGDTLYGGLIGFASSMADTVFTKITGKSVGDTVLSWAEDLTGLGPQTPVGLAANVPANAPAAVSSASLNALQIPDIGALVSGAGTIASPEVVGAAVEEPDSDTSDPVVLQRANVAYRSMRDIADNALSSIY